MSDIIITEFMDEAPLAALRERYSVRFEPTLVDDRPALLNAVAQARAIIVRNRTQVDGELLQAAPQLRAVGRLGVGLDNIDLDACKTRDVRVLPATGANDVAVAEYVIAAALMLRRGAYEHRASMQAGDWPRSALIGLEVSGATMGLVGFGGIARKVAVRAKALGMRVIAHDPNLSPHDECWAEYDAEPMDFKSLVAESDVISLHVPLVAGTRHLIDAAALARMKSSAVIVNSARGGVIDDAALADALAEGTIAAAALDVFEDEPLPAGSVYASLDNVLLTPHIAGVTVQSNVRVSQVTVDNVLAALEEATA
ncbi:hydroxyacid dehydrogenase [Salinisphaera hydrothermalis]|uniref:NAD-binding D-isomer specific 2-hydroxyacid dehydrogenase n=1 Tax=Salinisphaera hydrothermalis (strain C41B8) TaxID=1304275 RepID=A0A084IPN2_SALHC|nr:hydroxyacid dehydrogenase [Salinisphaera hydrothermalis]KEZ78666.1 NAD-binding D-isomer specific 2-hydroxyacid dehydrogenase [Salinisphaera hydrothermalis C41B8]